MAAGTLDVYWFRLDVAPAVVMELRALLSAEERARADRYLLPEHGQRFTVAHARLRAVLAARLGMTPQALRFEVGPQGKPVLEGAPLHFNLSHSAGVALVGIHEQREVGVDVEMERPQLDVMGLARRFFTANEAAWLAALPAAERAHGFSRLWTCKEAWLKADGRGMAVLEQVEVELSGTPPRLRAGTPAREWFVRELNLTPGYAAAVVQAEPPAGINVVRLGMGPALAPAAPSPSASPAAAGPPPSATR